MTEIALPGCLYDAIPRLYIGISCLHSEEEIKNSNQLGIKMIQESRLNYASSFIYLTSEAIGTYWGLNIPSPLRSTETGLSRP